MKKCGNSFKPKVASGKVKKKHRSKKVFVFAIVAAFTLLFVLGVRNLFFDGNGEDGLDNKSLLITEIQFEGIGDSFSKYENGYGLKFMKLPYVRYVIFDSIKNHTKKHPIWIKLRLWIRMEQSSILKLTKIEML